MNYGIDHKLEYLSHNIWWTIGRRSDDYDFCNDIYFGLLPTRYDIINV